MNNLIIGLLGRAGAGKSTAGKMLCGMGDGADMAFADKLKSIVMELYGLSYNDVYTEDGKNAASRFDCFSCPQCHSLETETQVMDKVPLCSCKICGAIGDPKVFASKWTNRQILQFFGTEGARRIDPQVWVRYAMQQAVSALGSQGKEFVAFTDCRFPEEAAAIRAYGGVVWRINRPSLAGKEAGIKGHASETAMDSIVADVTIENDSTLGVLQERLATQFKRLMVSNAAHGEATNGEKAGNALEA